MLMKLYMLKFMVLVPSVWTELPHTSSKAHGEIYTNTHPLSSQTLESDTINWRFTQLEDVRHRVSPNPLPDAIDQSEHKGTSKDNIQLVFNHQLHMALIECLLPAFLLNDDSLSLKMFLFLAKKGPSFILLSQDRIKSR